jgi:hypothetical protein
VRVHSDWALSDPKAPLGTCRRDGCMHADALLRPRIVVHAVQSIIINQFD